MPITFQCQGISRKELVIRVWSWRERSKDINLETVTIYSVFKAMGLSEVGPDR